MSRYIEVSMAQAVFDEGDKSLFDIAPSIDIVRCKECKYDGTWKCKWRDVMTRSFPSADDFCSYGERREP
jgi:hypothetical protein